MALTVVGTDRDEVRDRLRRALGDGRDVEEALVQAGDRWLVGTVDDVVERLAAYHDAGVSRVMLQQLDHADSEQTALIGDRLVPAVRK
jgi:alkanesulfonate monooxygenase SsuD/methylene tetrahydromethanopterin reductase-like flavin-dependent oxidoreductase (luciferase family)